MDDFKDTDDRCLADVLAALRRETLDRSDPGRVIHDLQVHQLELEIQNRELREAQQALEESRNRYADLYDFAPVAYATLDRLSRITQMNLTAAQLLGVERGRVPDLILSTRLAPGDGLALLASLTRVLSTGEEASLGVTLGRPPAARHALRLVLRREGANPAGESATACRVILLDVTEIKRAQAVIHTQQRFLQSVVDGIVDPIRVTGMDHQVLLTNAAARVARIDGMDWPSTPSAHDSGEASGELDAPHPAPQVLSSSAPVKVIQRRQGTDGQTQWIERIGAPLRGAAGEVLGVIESSRDITEHVVLAERLQEREQQLEQLVKHDTLTGLPNRVLFADRLGQAMRQAQREHRRVAVLFFDLDRFKAINDSLGHPAGDQVLKQAAERMRALMRESDTVARLGGDEFAIVLGALEQGADAGLVAQKLVDAFKQPFVVDTRTLYVSASIGISLYPDDGDDVATLERNADTAMYRAKDQGRDTFRFYTEDMTAQVFAHVTLETALRQALANQEFVLHYQPQHDLESGAILGLEALIRWHHPLLGLIGPERFLPLAESTGLIVPMGAWVVHAASVQMKTWRDQGLLASAAVWVNLSNREMQDQHLAQTIEAIVKAVDLDPGALAVELTETWAMTNPALVAGVIRRLQGVGIAVGINAFGTGYSALATRDRLSARVIKIDQSLVAGLPGDAVGCAIVRAVIALGRALGVRLIAEGVETRLQADFLRHEGCGIGQGYLFSQPLPAAAFEVYARRRPLLDD